MRMESHVKVRRTKLYEMESCDFIAQTIIYIYIYVYSYIYASHDAGREAITI